MKVLGPAGIDYAGEAWQPIDRATPDGRQGRFAPATNAGPCPYGVELSVPADGGSEDQEYGTAAVGDRDASHAAGSVRCADMNAEFSSFEQRYWLLPESEILVVDDFTIPGLGEILARADLPAWRAGGPARQRLGRVRTRPARP